MSILERLGWTSSSCKKEAKISAKNGLTEKNKRSTYIYIKTANISSEEPGYVRVCELVPKYKVLFSKIFN